MTPDDIAALIQAKLDELNYGVTPFAEYGEHIAAAISRLTTQPPSHISSHQGGDATDMTAARPEPDEIAGLIQALNSAVAMSGDWRWLGNAAAALRALAQENERLQRQIGAWKNMLVVKMSERIRELEAERDAIRRKTIEECAEAIQALKKKYPWDGIQLDALMFAIDEIRALAQSERGETHASEDK